MRSLITGGVCATAAGDTSGMWMAAALTVWFWVLRKRPLLIFSAVFFLITVLSMPTPANARSAGPDTAKAGDPISTTQTNPTCSQCHGDGNHNHGNSLVITVPSRYVPGAKYNVTIEMLGWQTNKNGFEMIPKRLSGNNYVLAGSMAEIDLQTQVDGSGYAKHTATGNAFKMWTLEWTAPPAGSGPVTFYAVGNASNNSGGADNGDWITTANATSIESVAPTVASVNAPADNAIVMAVPTLSANIATDANGDALTYSFELCATASCATVLETVSDLSTGGATVSWLPTVTLVENTRYWWRAWANDGTSDGPKFAPVSFWIDAVPEAPGSPAISEPADGTSITTRFPLITVSNAVDPDPTDAGLLTYDFAIATDSGFATVITSITNVPEGAGETTWQIESPSPLENLETYYLLVTVRDLTNQTATSTASFSLDLTNALPTAPANLLPGGSIVTPAPTFQADASTDLDGDALTYFFALDTTTAFNSPGKRLADALATPSWTPGLPALIENQRYFWRVRAFDGKSFGPFASQTIFINAVNDAPAAPLSFAPLDGALVNDRTPALRIHAAADPDEDALTYIYEVARDAAFLEIVERSSAIAPAADDTVTWQPATLENEATYFWRAHAVDPFGLAGPDGAPFTFTLVNANLPPGAPSLKSGVEFSAGEDSAWPEIHFKATAPEDPDGDAIFLFYELYADSKLLVPVTSSTATLPGVAWEPDVKWTAGTYYVRVRAEDPFLTGPWSNTAKVTLSGPPPFAERELSATLRTEVTPGGCASRGGPNWAWVLLLLPLLRIRRSALVLLLFIPACGAPEETTTTISRSTSFAEVQSILNANCISCHSGDDPAGKLNLLAETNGAELIGVKPANPVALDRDYLRVTPGEPESSFILYKLTEPSLGEGERMPYRQPKLSADDVEVIRRWIANGALTE